MVDLPRAVDRTDYPELLGVEGRFEPLVEDDPAVRAHLRVPDDRALPVAADWSARTVPLELDPSAVGCDPVRLTGNHPDEGAFAPLRPR
ncbi:hypothetical protein [Nocardiopsis sp. RV163]|uniref:hypothetical protein n=1 Tax=Nocardiopsis sp. RV163 TaxID=1661388 RepID=UPI00064C2470|nr:hypothetical protein [Nocardiopsis sp. RV163]